MQSHFDGWFNKPVILQIALGELRVPLRGTIIRDSVDALRVRLAETWDVDIYKSLIVGIQEDAMVRLDNNKVFEN